jgi:hypothetical protein
MRKGPARPAVGILPWSHSAGRHRRRARSDGLAHKATPGTDRTADRARRNRDAIPELGHVPQFAHRTSRPGPLPPPNRGRAAESGPWEALGASRRRRLRIAPAIALPILPGSGHQTAVTPLRPNPQPSNHVPHLVAAHPWPGASLARSQRGEGKRGEDAQSRSSGRGDIRHVGACSMRRSDYLRRPG